MTKQRLNVAEPNAFRTAWHLLDQLLPATDSSSDWASSRSDETSALTLANHRIVSKCFQVAAACLTDRIVSHTKARVGEYDLVSVSSAAALMIREE